MPVLIMAAIVSGLVFVLLLVFRRELVGVDLSAHGLLRLYLYLASLASMVVLVVGLSAAIDWGMASTFGAEPVYGRPPIQSVCPVGEKCPDPAQLQLQIAHEHAQRLQQDLVRGATFTFFGVVLWVAHRTARSMAATPVERSSALRRAYLTLGTFTFGLSAIVLVPLGTFLALSVVLVPAQSDVYLQGYGDLLSTGLVSLPIWVAYVLRLVREFRTAAVAVRPAGSRRVAAVAR